MTKVIQDITNIFKYDHLNSNESPTKVRFNPPKYTELPPLVIAIIVHMETTGSSPIP